MAGVVIKFDASPVRPPDRGSVVVGDVVFCPAEYRCDFIELVFASDENDGIQNDTTDFLFKKITAADTITFDLIKDGLILATITDSTLGEYYDGFTAQPLYVGWQADWTAIFAAFSGGLYQVRTTTVILGETTEFRSRYFRLNTFDVLSADRTVKIESFQNGTIDSSEFDFTNLVEGGWRSSIRLSGVFGNMQPDLERDRFQDSSYREVQNRDTIERQYKLTAELVPESIHDRIATKDILASSILVTSYNVLQERKYEHFPVVGEGYSDVRFDGLGRTYFDISFSDRQKNIIKTNSL